MMTVKQADKLKFFCGFCKGRMSAGNFTSEMNRWIWTCHACGVSYSREGKLEKALGTPVKAWKEIPEGSLVVLEGMSREVV